VPLVIEE